jgi:acyl-CoA synthetase (AMP-forming)/AMP-acid ligase II
MNDTRPARDDFASFADVLRSRAAKQPDQPAFVFLDGRGNVADQRTYGALDAAASRIAVELQAHGLIGQPVLLAYPDGLDFVAALFGCFYAGCIAVPAPYRSGRRGGERIGAICRDCRPAAVLTVSRMDDDVGLRNAARHDSSRLVRIDTDTLAPGDSAYRPANAGPDALALLQYTSGSTSEPKGVMLTHGNLIANSAMIRDAFGHTAQSRGFSWLPLFHDMGLIGHVLNPVHVAGLSVLTSPLSFLQRPWMWLKAISDWRVTVSGGPSYAFELCLRRVTGEQARTLDLSAWQVAYCGSERVRPDVLERFAETFAGCGFRPQALYPCYGLAEATLMVAGGRRGAGMQASYRQVDQADRTGQRLVGCGRAWHDEAIRIVDPDGKISLPDGEIGEIWVTGANVGQGYWGRKDESAETFRARLGAGDDTYLRTGDRGFLQDGELYVVGRMKDTIVIRGSNHAAEDIEATVAASHSGFIGLPGAAFATEAAGEEQVVVVQEIARSAGDDERGAAAEAAFQNVTREHGLRLHELLLLRPGAVPRTLNGKVQRHRCRELYQAGGFDESSSAGLRWLGRNRGLAAAPSG